MVRKKKQPDLKSLHKETQKALDRLHGDMQKEASDEVVASKDIILSLVRYEGDRTDLVLRDYENYSEVLMNLLLKGVYSALVIDNLPETLKEEYAGKMIEAVNNVFSHVSTKLLEGVLKDADKRINNLV